MRKSGDSTVEKRHLEIEQRGAASVDPLVSVDLQGCVVGTDAATYEGNNGLRYQVDCARKIQINARTGFERPCLRVATQVEKGRLFGDAAEARKEEIVPKNADFVDINTFTNKDGPGTAITLNADKLDARDIDENDIPPFPFDLIEAEEPLLLIQKGQLIQIQKKRDDGWMYGFVVWEPPELSEENKDDRPSRRVVMTKPSEVTDIDLGGEADLEQSEANLASSGEAVWKHKNDQEDDLGGESAGWFPSIFVRPPAMKELKDMQDAMGGAEAARDALAVPDTWSDDSKAGMTTNVKFVKLNTKDAEWKAVEDPFIKSMGKRNIRIKSIDRIENLGLWQS